MSKKDLGLVLSGGGARGSFEVGVLDALTYAGRGWKAISGTSVGALNGVGMAMARPELQRPQFHILFDIWKGISKNTDIYKPHAPWILKYLWSMWKKSFYTMKPLAKIVDEALDMEALMASGVDMYVGTVNLHTGGLETFKLNGPNLTKQDVVDRIHASCVFPALFEPVQIDGKDYCDGGIRDAIPLKSLVQNHPEIKEFDVVITSPIGGDVPYKKEFKSAIDVGLRSAFIMADEVFQTDKLEGLAVRSDIKVNIFAPDYPLEDGFEFNQEATYRMYKHGREVGMRRLNELED